MKQRIAYFDILNIVACFSVIALHHNWLTFCFEPTAAWAQSLIIEVLCYFAVPVFFMLSGANLLDYQEHYSTNEFFKRRFLRAVLPFFLWSLLWGLLTRSIFKITGFVDLLNAIILSRFCNVYWFFLPLFMLYLMTPALVKIAQDKKLHEYFVLLTFLLGSFFPLLNKIFQIEGNVFVENSCMYVCMYALLGYYLKNYSIKKEFEFIIYIVALLMLAIRYFVTYFLSYQCGTTDKLLFSYAYPTAVFPAIAVFLLAKKVQYTNLSSKTVSNLKKISSCSLGVYLIHIGIVSIILPKVLSSTIGLSNTSFVYRVILPPFSYLICVAIVYFCKQLKILKYIFP